MKLKKLLRKTEKFDAVITATSQEGKFRQASDLYDEYLSFVSGTDKGDELSKGERRALQKQTLPVAMQLIDVYRAHITAKKAVLSTMTGLTDDVPVDDGMDDDTAEALHAYGVGMQFVTDAAVYNDLGKKARHTLHEQIMTAATTLITHYRTCVDRLDVLIDMEGAYTETDEPILVDADGPHTPLKDTRSAAAVTG